MVIAGIDYSLCGPAVCLYNNPDDSLPWDHTKCSFYFLTENKKQSEIRTLNIYGERLSDWNSDQERYESIADWAIDIVMGCSHVALEGYAYSASGRVFHIAENTGILKYKCYQASIPLDVVSPSHVKKIATGKGNADKTMMHQAFLAETGIPLHKVITPNKKEIGNPVSDLVDAYYICKNLFNHLTKV